MIANRISMPGSKLWFSDISRDCAKQHRSGVSNLDLTMRRSRAVARLVKSRFDTPGRCMMSNHHGRNYQKAQIMVEDSYGFAVQNRGMLVVEAAPVSGNGAITGNFGITSAANIRGRSKRPAGCCGGAANLV